MPSRHRTVSNLLSLDQQENRSAIVIENSDGKVLGLTTLVMMMMKKLFMTTDGASPVIVCVYSTWNGRPLHATSPSLPSYLSLAFPRSMQAGNLSCGPGNPCVHIRHARHGPPRKKDNVKPPSIHPAGSSMLFLPFLPFSRSHNCAVDLHMAYPWHVNGVETTLIISFPFHARLLLLPSPRCQCLCLHRFRNPGQRKW
jgi:hypothetical protein